MRKTTLHLILFVGLTTLSGCSGGGGGAGDDGGNDGGDTTSSYTIGGIVTGLASGASVVLQNNGSDQLTVSANEPFTFQTKLADGSAYNVVVAAAPEGQQCSVAAGAGTVNGADVTSVAVSCSPFSVGALYPVNGSNWNDYVKNDGMSAGSATDTACAGTEAGGYSACIHGGERRVARMQGVASCDGLSAADALHAFEWRCDTSEGYVRFVSTRLKADKRLADLIDFAAPAWKPNAVTVKNGNATIASSAPTPWWTNALVVDNDGISRSETVAGTVYLITSNATRYYQWGADKLGVVIKPGAVLLTDRDAPEDPSCAICVGANKFLWIEGDVMDQGLGTAVYLDSASFSVIRHVRASSTLTGVSLKDCSNNELSYLSSVNNGGDAVRFTGSSWNSVDAVTVGGSARGVLLGGASSNNHLSNVTSANNRDYGVSILDGSTNNILSGVVVANNGIFGFDLYNASANVFEDTVAAHNGTGISFNISVGNRFTGLLKMGNNAAFDCYVSGGVDPAGLVSGTCDNDGGSDAVLTTGVTLASSFVGKVSDDPVNIADSSGTATYPSDFMVFDWTGFSNEFRGWGMDGSAFPSADHRGAWKTGTGRIWDWSLATGDAVIKDVLVLPTGNDTVTHTWTDNSTTTFLRHARELEGDGDGFCESGETCLHTPNVGSYQGHGNLISTGSFTDGGIAGVTLVKHENNGR